MFNEEMMKNLIQLYSNPLFQKGFFDFFQKMQQEGIEAAKKFWNLSPEKNSLFPNSMEIYEKLIDFYIVLGFVPKSKHDEVLKENEKLKYENAFLRETIKQLQFKVFTEGGEKVQEAWKDIVDKQMELNKDISKNFFELFRQLKGDTQ
jgi:hypothetical protein